LYASSVKVKDEVKESIGDKTMVIDGALVESAPSSRGHSKVLLAGGDSKEVAQVLRSVDLQTEVVADSVGAASVRRSLSSLFLQGLRAMSDEVIKIGETVDAEDWIRKQVAKFLSVGPHDITNQFDEDLENKPFSIEELSRLIADSSSHSGEWPVLT